MPPDPLSPPAAPRGLGRTLAALGLVAVAVLVAGLTTRSREHAELARWTAEHALPHVSVVKPVPSSGTSSLVLPGRLQAWSRAPIHARVDGYLKRWTVDIGARVKAGELLGEIDTPDLDQQINQARADLALARANAGLARTTAARWEEMLKTQAVARQAVDEKRAEAASHDAMVLAAQAAVERLSATKAFARLLAPFDGTVTARQAATGQLVNAGSGGTPLYEISDSSKLRLYVNVPQLHVARIGRGTAATANTPDQPGKRWEATIESLSGAVDPASGTSLVQLVIDNPGGELLPGAFASVTLALPAVSGTLAIPASALIVDAGGVRVATLGAGDAVALKPVTIARDLGASVLIGTGLAAGDTVIENPPDGVVDGMRVAAARTED